MVQSELAVAALKRCASRAVINRKEHIGLGITAVGSNFKQERDLVKVYSSLKRLAEHQMLSLCAAEGKQRQVDSTCNGHSTLLAEDSVYEYYFRF